MGRAEILGCCAILLGATGIRAAGIATGSYGAEPKPPARSETNQAARTGQELEALRQRMRELARRKAEHKAQRDLLHEDLQAAEERIAEVGAQLHRIADDRDGHRERLAELRGRLEQQSDALLHHHDALGALIRAAYAVGRRSELELLLNQRDPMMASRLMLYYDYLHRSRARRVGAIQQAVKKLERMEGELEKETAALAAAEEKLAAERHHLVAAQESRKRLVEQLEHKIEDEGGRLEEMRADNRRLDALFERLVKESRQRFAAAERERTNQEPPPRTKGAGIADPAEPEPMPADADVRAVADTSLPPQPDKPFAALAGQLPWPVSGELEALFGTQKASGLPWDGVVIEAEEGTEVRAIYPGEVVFADWMRGFGLLLILDHGGGYMTLYGQNQALLKEMGDQVRAGEAVGLAGRSGGYEQSGVYFGVRHRGRPQNPKRWCGPVDGKQVSGGPQV